MTIGLVGLLVSCTTAVVLNDRVTERQHAALARATDHFVLATERALRQAVSDVSAVAGFFTASDAVTPTEFSSFVEHGFADRRELHAMTWIPGDRETRNRLHTDSADEAEAVPMEVAYVAPREYLERLDGVDLSRYSRFVKARQAATAINRAVAFVGNEIHELTDGRVDLVAVAPVFGQRGSLERPSEVGFRRPAGFVVGIYDIAEVLAGIENTSVTGIEYVIVDRGHDEKLVFGSKNHVSALTFPVSFGGWILSESTERQLSLSGISWLVKVAFDRETVVREHFGAIAMPLVTGGSLTFLLIIYVVRIERYSRSLRAANEGLELEAAERAEKERALRVMSMAIEQSAAAIMITFPDGSIEYVNRKFEDVTGYSRTEVIGKTPSVLKSGRTSPEVYRDLWRTVAGGGVWKGELLNRRRNGDTYWAAESIWPIRDTLGALFRLVAITEDITERLHVRERLKLLSHAVEQSSSMVLITGSDGLIKYVNRRYEEVTGRLASEVIGKNARVHQSGHTAQGVYESMWATILAGDSWQGELLNKKKNGDLYWVALTISPIKDDTGAVTHFLSVSEDITERKRAEARIEQLAHQDTLTGLANRFLFNERLREAFATAKECGSRLAVMAVDLDDFKGVNDTLGHDVGDLLLQEVAARLKASVRGTDTVARSHSQEGPLLARIGGDEFFVLLMDPGTPEQTARVAERLVANLNQQVVIDGNVVRSAASVGVAVYPDDSADPMGLIKCADLALYEAKAGGRNRYSLFEPRMQQSVDKRRALEHDLRRALSEDVPELVLHYQPQVELAWGRMVGCEALVRWNHPERGLISPGEFVPVAESSGLILQLGDWVIREACRQIAAWSQCGLGGLTVAVNLSAVQFRQGKLVETVNAALAESGIQPEQLAVEITETVMLTDTQAALETLNALSAQGIQVALDDFGTGYSSLGYLTKFPVDKIKLDRAFVTGLTEDSAKQAIMATVVELGHKLGTVVTAEGVETLDQVRALCMYEVDEIQGFYLSKPLVAEALAELARDSGRFAWLRDERKRTSVPPCSAGGL